MKPIFANSAWVRAPEKLIIKGGTSRRLQLKVRYGIGVHPNEGAFIIDTGYGPQVTRGTRRHWTLKLYNQLFGPSLNLDGALDVALAKLDLEKAAVRNIVITHFHPDHTSELSQFPDARVFAHRLVFDAICQRSRLANLRHGVFPELLPEDLADRLIDIGQLPDAPAPLGLGSGKDLFSDGSILAIDLPGHAEGHFGLCFPQNDTPLLYAVDAQWLLSAILEHRFPGFPASLVTTNAAALGQSARRIAEFHQNGGNVILCHDPATTQFDLPVKSDV